MRQLARCSVLALALAGASQVAQAQALEFHGYTRSAIGMSSEGGRGACFGLAGADTKYRLGNECDTVIEPTFTARFANLEDKSAWGVTFMPNVYSGWGGAASSGPDLDTGYGQIYLFGENIPQLANGRIWAGRRFYQRLQLGINDQFLENLDGDGAGLEDMNLGFGKLSVAWQMNPYGATDAFNTQAQRLSARLTDIKTFPEGALSFYTHYAFTSNSDDKSGATVVTAPDTESTWHVGAYHQLNGVLGGSNTIGLAFEGGDRNASAANPNGDSMSMARFVVQQTGFISGPQIAWDAIAEFQTSKYRNNAAGKSDWFSIGGRLDGHIAGPFRWLTELGYDSVKDENQDTRHLLKFTGALAVSAGPNAWSRPTFRVYYTYANWNDAAIGKVGGNGQLAYNGVNGNSVYGNNTNGGTFGIQGEAWW